MPRFVPNIPDWFPTRKAAQVAAFFASKAGGSINVLRLTKLMYLADRRHMEVRDVPITGDNFVSMPFGPVNTYAYSYINGDAPVRQEQWAEFIAARQGYAVPLTAPIEPDHLDEISRSELATLESTWDEFKDVDRYDLAELTHKFCPEWRDPGESSVPIDLATVYKHLGKEDPIGLAEDVQADRQLAITVFRR